MSDLKRFLGACRRVGQGSRGYKIWLAFLLVVIGLGIWAYSVQLREGLVVTSMRNQVAWGFYISNFTFLAAAAPA